MVEIATIPLGWFHRMTTKSAIHPLTAFRKRVGWTQTALAGKLGQFQQNIQRYEAGRIPPRALRLKIADLSHGEVPASLDFWDAVRERMKPPKPRRRRGAVEARA